MIKKLAFFILFLIVGFFVFLPIPELSLIKESSKVTYLDRHGDFLGHHYLNGHGSNIPLSRIPSAFIDLLLIAEDKNFYEHSGIDLKALSRAMIQNISSLRIVSGASTLTQQLVRVVFDYDRNFLSKLLVMLHTLKVELFLDKGEILELYLNLIPFSNQQIGIANASNFYFDKSVDQLSLSEMSTLVALIRSPSSLSSKKGLNRLTEIKNNILKIFLSENNYSDEQIALNLNSNVDFVKARDISTANHFINFILLKLLPKD